MFVVSYCLRLLVFKLCALLFRRKQNIAGPKTKILTKIKVKLYGSFERLKLFG